MSTTKVITPLQRFIRLLKPDRREIRNIYIYAIFNGLINLSLPLGIQAIVNLIQGGRINTSWIVLVCIVVLGVALTGILQIFQLRIVENLQQKIFTRAAFEFAFRIPKIRLEALYRTYAPELMNRFFDIMSVQKGLSKMLIDFSSAVLQMIFGLILLSLYHPFFILFSLVLILFVVIVFRLTASTGLEKSLIESKHKYAVAYWLEELARTATTFKLAGKTDLAMQRTDERVTSYLDARESHFGILVRQYSMMVIFKVLVVSGLLAIGGILVMEQLMNIGQFVAAEIIILLIIASVEKLVLSVETIYDVLTGLEKIGQVTDLELDSNEGIDLYANCSGPGVSIELQEVSYRHRGAKRNAIEELNLEIKAGETVMITGRNATGKSTLLYLLAGLYDVDDGTVLYEGLPKGNLSLETIRSVIGDCLSQEQMFEGTLIANISLGHKNVDFARVQEVARAIGLDTYIEGLSLGYDTPIDPLGRNLPTSIVQLVLIARCVCRRPKLLLIEDAFEHLDTAHKNKVIDYLCDPSHGWTIVVSSNDDYMGRKASRILKLEDGRITAQGTYDDMKNQVSLKSTNDA